MPKLSIGRAPRASTAHVPGVFPGSTRGWVDLAALLARAYLRRCQEKSSLPATPDVSASYGSRNVAPALDVHGEESPHVLRRTGGCQTA